MSTSGTWRQTAHRGKQYPNVGTLFGGMLEVPMVVSTISQSHLTPGLSTPVVIICRLRICNDGLKVASIFSRPRVDEVTRATLRKPTDEEFMSVPRSNP